MPASPRAVPLWVTLSTAIAGHDLDAPTNTAPSRPHPVRGAMVWFLGPPLVHDPSGVVIGSTVFAGLTTVPNSHTVRLRQRVRRNRRRAYAMHAIAMRWSIDAGHWHAVVDVWVVIVDIQRGRRVSNKCIAVREVATPLWELTCHMGSHSVTCHPAEVTFPPLPQPKLVLD